MRYEELPGPLEGWTYDDNGTIYTANGNRCSAQQIEAALWLMQCFSIEARRFLIHSDEAPGALRPVYELSDLSARQQPTRITAHATMANSGAPTTTTDRGQRVSGKRF